MCHATGSAACRAPCCDLLLTMPAAMVHSITSVRRSRARHVDEQWFPSWMRPGDRPLVRRVSNRPPNVELPQVLEGSPRSNWRPFFLSSIAANSPGCHRMTSQHDRPNSYLAKILASLSLLLLSALLVTILVPVLAVEDRLFGNSRTDECQVKYVCNLLKASCRRA